MKPVKLRLSGLQSYRDAQEIDFRRLTEAGVFGIFGPTGSGKSSILDAVTLALYGKVERAPGGTQGILNQAEKALAVAFQFELSGGGESREYRVERQFKRGGDVSVNNTLSRFIEITPQGEVVLADKLAEVNHCVEEHIGLGMQDFTRAVVLPQGKFAEFLSLAGKDRRSMLQRLFSLHRYGDTLAQRLTQRVKSAEAALAEAAAEQLGLGDASAEAVQAAGEARTAAAAELAAERARLAAAEAEHAERLQVRERQEELRLKEAMLAKLSAEAPAIERKEQELQRLETAERLLAPLAARDAAEAELRRMAARREEAGRIYAARQEAAAAAAAAWSAAQQEAAGSEPRLALRLEQLAQAQRLERETETLAAEIADGAARLAAAEARGAEASASAARTGELLDKAAARQQELKNELQRLELTPDERQRWMELGRRREQLASAETGHAEAERACREAEAAEAEAGRAAAEAADVHGSRALAVAALPGTLAEPLARLRALEAAWREAYAAIPERIEALRGRERELSRLRLARQLAADLRSGEACPVCGSTEHPGHPALAEAHADSEGEAEAGDEESRRLAAELNAWEQLRSDAGSLLLSLAPLLQRAERLTQLIGSAASGQRARAADGSAGSAIDGRDAGTVTAKEAAAASDAAAGESRAAVAAQLAGAAAEAAAGLADAAAAAAEAERYWTAQEQAVDRALEAVAEADRRLELARADHAARRASAAAAAAKRDELARALQAQREAWRSAYGAMTPEEADAWAAGLEKREQEARKAREGLDLSVPFIERKTKERQEAERAVQEAKLEAVQLAARLESRRQVHAEKSGQLREWTGGTPAAALIEAAERELTSLRERVRSCREAQERAAAQLQEAAERRTASLEAEQSAAERFELAERQWIEALRPTGFDSAEDVHALQPLLPQKSAIQAEVARHREAEKQLAAQIAMLRERLDGRSLDEAEWEACVQRLSEAKTRADAAIQAAARAERAYEELAEKHERWMKLEAKRADMQALTGRLAQLQSVFRGNAFVEYVAEEQLVQVCRAASERLGFLTKRRYALEVDSGGGFVIRDDANGGIRRPVSTLSGGETFLTSLALALALSAQIQLRGRYPLQFFFLDEGFGTLDPELLETVITALEKLHTDKLAVGVISHVPELRARLPRRLVVTPAEPSGAGSRVQLETL